MSKHGKFTAFLMICLLMPVSIRAQTDAAVHWQQQHYQPIYFDFNRDQVPDLLLQTKSELLPSRLVLGEYSHSQVMFLQKNSTELPAKISGLAWSVADAQLLPLRRIVANSSVNSVVKHAAGTNGLLVIFPKQQHAILLAGSDGHFNFSQPINTFKAAQWPFLAKVDDFELHAGDFDNDGADEILQLGKISGEHEILNIQSNASLSGKQNTKKKVAWGLRGKARIIVRDFNNDGAADIFALAKSPGTSHYLMMSDNTGQLTDIDGETVLPTLGGLPWFDDSSGTQVVKLLKEQRPVLLRLYNDDEAKNSGNGCIGWLFDPLQKTSQEYCPDAKTPEQGDDAKLASPQLEYCEYSEFATLPSKNDDLHLNSWCPPQGPQAPLAPPQIDSSSYAVNQIFNMQLPNTWDPSALTYEVWAVRSGSYSNFTWAEAPGGNFSLPSVTASGRLEVAGSYHLMYRSCNSTGCSGFGPGIAVTIYGVSVTQTVTATAGAGGSISPNSRTVLQGDTTTFAVTANSGFTVNPPTGCNGTWVGNTYTTGVINGPCNVNATFNAASSAAQVIFLHTDVLGSVIAETNTNGVVIKKTEYKPFGQSIDN